MKGWKKIRLAEEIDFDDRISEEPDNEGKISLQDAMEELMIESDTNNLTEDFNAEETVIVPVETTRTIRK